MEQWLQSAFYNLQVSHEDIESFSKILKVLERNYQDNEDTVFCTKVLQGQGGPCFEKLLQSVVYNSKVDY